MTRRAMWFLAGFIAGGILGYLAGILSAPTAGEETRRQLSRGAIELRERAEETATRVKETIAGAAEGQQKPEAEA